MSYLEQNLSRSLMEYGCRASLRHNFIYFSNAKAACSTIQTTLAKYEMDAGLRDHYQGSEGLNQKGYKYFQNDLSIYQYLCSFYKFTFVRNPYARILSAYLDKMLNREDDTYKHVFRLFPELENELSFTAFLKCLSRIHPEQMNPHWRPQVYNIMQGFIPYNYIGFVENMHQDFGFVCKELFGGGGSIVNVFRHSVGAIDKCRQHYADEDIMLVREIYAADFEYLNYSVDLDDVSAVPSRRPAVNFNDMIISRFSKSVVDFDRGRYDSSLEQLEYLEQMLPQNPFIPELAAKCLFEMQRYEQALAKAEVAGNIAPQLPGPKTIKTQINKATAFPGARSLFGKLRKIRMGGR